MPEILMIATAGLWLNSAATIHSDTVNDSAVWLFLLFAVCGTAITYSLI